MKYKIKNLAVDKDLSLEIDGNSPRQAVENLLKLTADCRGICMVSDFDASVGGTWVTIQNGWRLLVKEQNETIN